MPVIARTEAMRIIRRQLADVPVRRCKSSG